IPDNATVQSVVDDLSHAGQIHFTSTRTGKFVPATLKVKNLNGQNGMAVHNMCVPASVWAATTI
ncbi:hypothetical protein ACE4QB_004669, partial [Escherichia coli]